MIAAALLALPLLAWAPAEAAPPAQRQEPAALFPGESVFAGVVPPRLPPHGLREAMKLATAGAHREVALLCAPSIAAENLEEIPCRLLSATSLLELGAYREAERLLLPAIGRLGPLEPWGALFLAEARIGARLPAEGPGSIDSGEGGSTSGWGGELGEETEIEPDESLEGGGGTLPPPPDTISETNDDSNTLRKKEILPLLERARQVDPGGPLGARAALLRARLEVQEGQPREAIRILRSLRGSPYLDGLDLRVALADATRAAGDLPAAIAAYRSIWKESAGLPVAALAARRLEALAAEGSAVPTPTLAERLARVEALLSRGRAQEAFDELESLHEGPQLSAPRLAHLRARALWDLDRKEESEALLAPYLEEDAALDPSLVSLGARLAMRRGATELAVARLDRIARGTSGRTRAEAAFLAAFFLYDDGRFEDAEERFRAFRANHPGHRGEETRWYVAWILFKQGRHAEAAAELSQLIARASGSALLPQASYWRARALALAGEAEKARAALEDVARRWPGDWYGILAEERLRQAAPAGEPRAAGGERESIAAAVAAEPSQAGGADARGDEISKDRPAASSGTLEAADERGGRAAPVASHAHLMRASGADGGLARAEALYACGLPHLAGEELDRALTSGRGADGRQLAFFAGLAARAGDPFRAYQLGLFRLGGVPELAYPLAYEESVRAAARRHGVEPYLIWAIMRQESGFRRTIRSPANAVGLMQILPITARRLGALLAHPDPLENRLEDPRVNIALGTFYLGALLDRFGGHPALAAAAYNAGPPAVARWLEDPSRRDLPLDEFVDSIPFRETRGYVKVVMANLHAYRRIHGGEAPPPLALTLPRPAAGIDF